MRDMIKLCAECTPAGEVPHGTPVMICEHGQATPVRQADGKPRHTCEEWCHCRKCGGFKMGGVPYGFSCSCPEDEVLT